MSASCVFCRIGTGEIPVDPLYEDDGVIAFVDQTPQAPTHLLVIPKRHYANLAEADAELLGDLLHTAAELGSKRLPDGYRVVVNTGNDGGQTVHHLHLHILGGRHMGWPPG